jgi:hypothetical protein
MRDATEHFCRLFFIDLFWCKNAVRANLHAPTTSNALAVVNRTNKPWCPFLLAAR